MDIAKRVAELRKQRGWSQPELARRAGISKGIVGWIEQGRVGNTGKLPQIARAFNLTVDQLTQNCKDAGERDDNEIMMEAVTAVHDAIAALSIDLSGQEVSEIVQLVAQEIKRHSSIPPFVIADIALNLSKNKGKSA